MKNEQFQKVVALLGKECDETLLNRQQAYADEDRLSNFKEIASLTGLTEPQVCMVLHSKHIVALAKAIREGRHEAAKEYIVDIINYQRLMLALLVERTVPNTTTRGV
jgi:hypothetical protein